MEKGLIIAGAAVFLLIVWFGLRKRENFEGGDSPRGITQVIPDDGKVLGGNIAGVDRHSGIMYVNVPLIKQRGINSNQLFFIMLHEMAHMKLQSSDEKRVDEWAHKEYMKRGHSLQDSIYALSRVLRFNKEEDFERGEAQLKRALQFDNKL